AGPRGGPHRFSNLKSVANEVALVEYQDPGTTLESRRHRSSLGRVDDEDREICPADRVAGTTDRLAFQSRGLVIAWGVKEANRKADIDFSTENVAGRAG